MASSNGNKRRLRRLAVELEDLLGADGSRLAHSFSDGWSIVRLRRLNDQLREGFLMRHCLAAINEPRPCVWSLRDPENLPHATFTLLRVGPSSPVWSSNVMRAYESAANVQLVVTGRLVLVPDRSRHLKPAYLKRLKEFAEHSAPVRGLPLLRSWRDLAMAAGDGHVVPADVDPVWWFETVRDFWQLPPHSGGAGMTPLGSPQDDRWLSSAEAMRSRARFYRRRCAA